MNLKKIFFTILTFALLFTACKTGKQNATAFISPAAGEYTTVTDITENDIHLHISVLASDSLQGRKAGTPYEALAANYIKERFISLGLKAFNDNYFQPFQVFSRKFFNGCELYFDGYSGEYATDFRPLVMFDSLTLAGEVVFAGYGYESDYDNFDATGKWVMILEGKGADKIIPKANQDIYSRYDIAKNKGILGVLTILSDEAVKSEQTFLQSTASSVPIIKISIKTAENLLAQIGVVTFSEALSKVTAGDNYIIPIPVTVHAVIKSQTQAPVSQNVVAYLEANDSGNNNGYFLVGAHYDHIGTQTVGDTTLICYGADDNASGVAGILELAEKLCSVKNLKYNVIFAAFGAEEVGLIGSAAFCKTPPVPLEKIKLMVNLDMIGRMNSENAVYIHAIKPTDKFDAVLDELKESHSAIHVAFSADSRFGGSDHASFHSKQIPALSFTTGLHNEYHTPGDSLSLINCKGGKLLLDFVYDFILKEESL